MRAIDTVHTLTGAYVVHALEEEDRARFEEHLPQCPDCQAEVASLTEAAASMAEDAAVPPPPRLRADVLAAIQHVRPLPPQARDTARVTPLAQRRKGRRGRRIALLAAAAAAVLGLGAGAAWHPWTDDRPAPATVTAMDRVLGAPDAVHASVVVKGGGVITVVRSESEGHGAVVTRDMPPAPRGKAYELWLRGPDGRMLPAGLMRGSGAQKVMLTGDTRTANAFAVTLEPAGGSKQPTSPPLGYTDLPRTTA